jgi:hypothetical protein
MANRVMKVAFCMRRRSSVFVRALARYEEPHERSWRREGARKTEDEEGKGGSTTMEVKGGKNVPTRGRDLADRSRRGRPVERKRVENSISRGKGRKGGKKEAKHTS